MGLGIVEIGSYNTGRFNSVEDEVSRQAERTYARALRQRLTYRDRDYCGRKVADETAWKGPWRQC